MCTRLSEFILLDLVLYTEWLALLRAVRVPSSMMGLLIAGFSELGYCCMLESYREVRHSQLNYFLVPLA